MPRSRTIPSATYQPGTYGPFSLDGFTRGNADYIEAIFTVEGWPTASPVLTVTGQWSNGTPFGASFAGGVLGRGGVPPTQVSMRAFIPTEAGAGGQPSKRDVVSGTVTLTAHVPLTTAVTIRAV